MADSKQPEPKDIKLDFGGLKRSGIEDITLDFSGLGPADTTLPEINQSPSPEAIQDLFLETPAYHESIASSARALREAGYDQGTINAIIQPAGLAQHDEVIDWGPVFETLSPVFQKDGRAALETLHQVDSLRERGIAITPDQTSALHVMLSAFAEDAGPDALEALADAHRWWRRAGRAFAESAAGGAATKGLEELGLGLASLDFFSVINKAQKLPFLPAESRAEVAARVMPTITLEDAEGEARQFTSGTTAALWTWQQRLKGVKMLADEATGQAFTPARLGHSLGELVRTGEMPQAAEGGMDAIRAANQPIPALTAGIGEHLSWEEVAARNIPYLDPKSPDNIYDWISDLPGHHQNEALWGMALGWGLADVFGDLMWLLPGAGIPTKAAELGRPLGRALAKAGKGTTVLRAGKIAKKTETLQDALNSLDEAQVFLAKMRRVGETQKANASTGRMTSEQARRIHLAKKMETDAEAFKETFKDPGAYEVIMLRRTPRRKPGLILEADEAAAKMSDVPSVVKELSKSRELELRRDFDLVATFEKQTPAEISRRAVMGPSDSEQVGDALNLAYRTGGMGIDDVAITPYSVIDQRYPDVTAGLIKNVPKNSPKIQQEFGTLERFAKSDLSKNTIRILLNDLEKTRKSLGEARNAAKGPVVAVGPKGKVSSVGPSKAIANLEKEIEAMRRTKPTRIDTGPSPLSRGRVRTTGELIAEREVQLDRLRRELQGPNKPLIQRLEGEMSRIKKQAKDLSKQDFFKEHAKYDDVYLPGAANPEIETPAGFNRMLEKFGDHLSESLYPGSFMLNRFWDTKGGQLFSWLREPLRYYDQYDPKTSELLRGGYLRYKNHTDALNEVFSNILTNARVLTPRGKWNPAKHFKPYKMDKQRTQDLFHIMNEENGSPAFRELYQAADPDMRRAADELRPIFEHFADRYGISDTEKYINGYIHHFLDPSVFANKARPLELGGLPAKANVFVSHLLNRTGEAGFEPDIVLALDLYNRAMNRKLILEPVFEGTLQAGERLAAQHGNAAFSTYSKMLVRHLKGQPSFVGKMLDEALTSPLSSPGKKYVPGSVDRALMGMTGLLWGGTLAGNPRYPIMQMATGAITTASRFGVGRTTKGLFQMATPEGQAMARKLGVYQQFTDMFEAPFMKQLSIALSEVPAITPLGVMSTAKTEFFIRGAAAHAAMDMYMTKMGFASWDAAVAAGWGKRIAFQGVRAAEETNHMYGALGRSPLASAILPKGLVISGTQFLSFVPKQVEELLSQFNRNPGHIAEYLMLSGWLARVAAEEGGIDLTEYVGLGFIPQGGDDITSPAVGMLMEGMHMLSAIQTHDPDRATMHMERFMDTGNNLIPLMNVWKTAGKSAERLYYGEARTSQGVKTRNMDFEGLKQQRENPDMSLMRKIMESIRPDEEATFGGDFIPSATGQRNINDQLYHRGKTAITASNKKRLFLQRSAAQKVVDAALRKDQEDLAKAVGDYNQLVIDDEFRIDPGQEVFKTAFEAAMFSWAFREFDRNKKYRDKVLDVMSRSDMDITP